MSSTIVNGLPPPGLPAADTPSPSEPDTGLVCLVMLARYHGLSADPEQIAHRFAEAGQTMRLPDLLLAARQLGLHAKVHRPTPERLAHLPLPGLGQDTQGHFFVVARVEGEGADLRVLIHEPLKGAPQWFTAEELLQRWSGEVVLFTSRTSLIGQLARFDFSWFIPAIVKYRRLLLEVLAVSLVLQLFALVTPLFFQVVMDKVLVHQSLSTLDVIAVGLLVVSIFEVVLGGLRSFVFSHTSSRIDVELGARMFRHLLHLPMGYFQARRVGDSVARVRELENIRSFLTGNAITVVLDLVFSVVFIGVMLLYSGWLTLIVVISLPCYFALSILITPALRRRLDEKFNRGADNQSFLVESVSGIDTLKSMAVEPQWTRQWDGQLAAYVRASFRAVVLSILAGSSVQMVSKLVTVATMWMGARLVIDGELSLGQLIAFNMLAGHVANPVMRLAQMWTEFQQVGISMQRLGDVLNTRTETEQDRCAMPALRGQIEFDQTVFRYRHDAPEVLRGISLLIEPGEVVAFVGRSGSGKSTMARLVQRMHMPERGRVLIDGQDLALIDTASLRRQVGVVPQENVLFNRSVRANIALSDPGVPLEAVMQAARLAGAHDFISELPEGYDTTVGEHGASLSGGQRQRIAIARALLGNPRILIFDEATSALDYESERAIQDNMKTICAGRTVLIIAHRLSTVRNADRIVVLDRGQIIEQGSHDELLARPDGAYAHLWHLQEG